MSDLKNTPMTHLTGLQALAVARALAVEKMPYFRMGVLNLVPREAPGLGTLGLTTGSVLLYDEEKLRSWTPEEAAAVLLHEYMHEFLRHDQRKTRLEDQGVLVRGDEADWQLSNDAADAEINDDLLEAGLKLPGGPITPQFLGLKPNRLYEEYVAELKAKKGPRKPHANPGAGCGHCGSAGGMPCLGEADAKDDARKPGDPPPARGPDPDARPEADREATRRAVAEAVRSFGEKSQGRLPAGLRRFAEEFLKPARVPWPLLLARRVRRAVAHMRGAGDYTRTRPSRRQGAFMDWPEGSAPVLLGQHRPIVEVGVVFDTSGSVGERELNKMAQETQGVLNACGGSKVWFAACDAKVHSLVRVKNLAEVKRNIHGGGGTDFRPAFAALDRCRPRPSVVVFATDGYGAYPDKPPAGMEVIWLNVGGQISAGWGDVIDATPEEE